MFVCSFLLEFGYTFYPLVCMLQFYWQTDFGWLIERAKSGYANIVEGKSVVHVYKQSHALVVTLIQSDG